MIGKSNGQGSLIQLVSLEELVPEKHFLRSLDRVLDLSFISQFLSPAYHPTHGREGIGPALAMRMLNGHRSRHCVHRAVEGGHDGIALGVQHPAPAGFDLPDEDFAVGLERPHGLRLVVRHQL